MAWILILGTQMTYYATLYDNSTAEDSTDSIALELKIWVVSSMDDVSAQSALRKEGMMAIDLLQRFTAFDKYISSPGNSRSFIYS